MIGRWNLFRKFIIEALTASPLPSWCSFKLWPILHTGWYHRRGTRPKYSSTSPRFKHSGPNGVPPTFRRPCYLVLYPFSSLVHTSRDRQGSSPFLVSSTLPLPSKQAHRISSPDLTASPLTTTAPDDVFYILKSVITRLLTTGSVSSVILMSDQLRDLLDRDYIAVYKRRLEDVYKGPQSGVRSDKMEREMRMTFIVGAIIFLACRKS